MEVTEAVSLLLAGADILVLRHPEAVKLVKNYSDMILDEGQAPATDLKDIQAVPMDKLPVVEFTPSGPPKKEVKAAPAKKAVPEKKEKPAPAKKAEPVKTKEATAPKEEPKEEAPKVVAIDEAKVKAEAESAWVAK